MHFMRGLIQYTGVDPWRQQRGHPMHQICVSDPFETLRTDTYLEYRVPRAHKVYGHVSYLHGDTKSGCLKRKISDVGNVGKTPSYSIPIFFKSRYRR